MSKRFQLGSRGFYWRIWGKELGNRVWMNCARSLLSEKIFFGAEFKKVTYCWRQLTFGFVFFHIAVSVCWDPIMSRQIARLHEPSLPERDPVALGNLE